MRTLQRWLLLLTLLLAAGCARGPEQATLEHDVQQRLDELFGSRVLEVRSLKRQGSSPAPKAAGGGSQAVVYYNARFEFVAPYDPSDWQGLSPELIAKAIGATGSGVIGLNAGPVREGTELRAYGSLQYRREGDAWVPALLQLPARAARPATSGGASQSDELVERLARVVDTTPGLHGADQRIVMEELNRALHNIALRSDRGGPGLIVATGPEGGEYSRFVEALRPRAVGWAVQAIATEGSVDNALRVDAGEARFGLVQSDVAAAAVTGTGAFEASGPLRHLRGVAALFPELLHLVVHADSGIDAPAQLAGRRVATGLRGSGTRRLARQVLREHGLADGAYLEAEASSPGEALALLAEGRIDAVIVVVSAPWQQMIEVATRTPLRILPLDPMAIAAIDAAVPGLLALAVPPRTYPGQEEPVPTVAATALLVANAAVPDPSVRRVLDFLFSQDLAASRGLAASRLSRERARSGMTLPLHDGAVDFFRAVPAPRSNAAP